MKLNESVKGAAGLLHATAIGNNTAIRFAGKNQDMKGNWKMDMDMEKICNELNKINRVLDIIKIAKHYGIENQLVKAIEEYSELIKAVTKYKQKPTVANKMQITEEIADCWIMTGQLVYLLDLDADVIENMMNEKIERQIRRIEGKHEEEK